jgi:hypothetical protein
MKGKIEMFEVVEFSMYLRDWAGEHGGAVPCVHVHSVHSTRHAAARAACKLRAEHRRAHPGDKDAVFGVQRR